MNISRKPCFTRRHFGQAIISSVALAAIPGILSLAGLGLPDTVAAQPAPPPAEQPAPPAPPGPPAPPIAPAVTPITFGQTINGSLSSTDRTDRIGRPRDHYRLILRNPNSRYVLTARSQTVPIRAEISFRNVAVRGDPLVPLQEGNVFAGGQTLQFSGTLAERGEYQIEVSSTELQDPVGTYTISVSGPTGTAPQ